MPERKGKMKIILILLVLLEVVFLSWAFASNLPRRSADVNAFMRYQNAPTEENKALWLKERQTTQSEVNLRVTLGVCLATANLILIGWVARRSKTSLT